MCPSIKFHISSNLEVTTTFIHQLSIFWRRYHTYFWPNGTPPIINIIFACYCYSYSIDIRHCQTAQYATVTSVRRLWVRLSSWLYKPSKWHRRRIRTSVTLSNMPVTNWFHVMTVYGRWRFLLLSGKYRCSCHEGGIPCYLFADIHARVGGSRKFLSPQGLEPMIVQ